MVRDFSSSFLDANLRVMQNGAPSLWVPLHVPSGRQPSAARASQGHQKTPLLPPPKARLFPEVMWGLEGNLVYQRCVGTSIILWRLRRAGDKTIDETHCEESPLAIVRVLFEPPL